MSRRCSSASGPAGVSGAATPVTVTSGPNAAVKSTTARRRWLSEVTSTSEDTSGSKRRDSAALLSVVQERSSAMMRSSATPLSSSHRRIDDASVTPLPVSPPVTSTGTDGWALASASPVSIRWTTFAGRVPSASTPPPRMVRCVEGLA